MKKNSFREKQVFSLQTFSFTRTIVIKYVKIMMTYKGPIWVPHGLKFLYGTHIGPIWASCPDSAHMGPICPCVLGWSSKNLFTWSVGPKPCKPCFSFFIIFVTKMREFIVIFTFTRQLYFYVLCICEGTLLSKMSKLVWRYSGNVRVIIKTCTHSTWRKRSRECNCR